jgi:hypothetical protein
MIAKILSGFKSGLETFNLIMFTPVSAILVSIIFFFGVGTASLMVKLSKTTLFNQHPSKKSSWTDIDYEYKEKESFFRQY